MADILCRWLNDDICLEPKFAKSTLSKQFSNGYLYGEILHKHGLQRDFQQFSCERSSEAKLNNFLRLEPTIRLLEIPFNINVAHDIMTEKEGVATGLLYQIFVALKRLKNGQLVGQSLKMMRPPGKIKLEKIETDIFSKKLKQKTRRQSILNFDDIALKYQERQRILEESILEERRREEERVQQERRVLCYKSLDNSRLVRERQAKLYAKLKPLSTSKAKPPGHGGERSRTADSTLSKTSKACKQAEATRQSINTFETNIERRTMTSHCMDKPRPFSTGSLEEPQQKNISLTMVVGSSADYMSHIRRRMMDNDLSRKDREKRRRKMLVEQMQALQNQESTSREKMLVERLMRQCQQERRIATQLMAIRKEKDTIRNNCVYRLQQYEEQRMNEFREAEYRERELARCELLDRADRMMHQQIIHQQNVAHKADMNYLRNYKLLRGILLQIVDFATRTVEYNTLTQGLIPAKVVKDWKSLFVAGRSLYEEDNTGTDTLLEDSTASLSGHELATSKDDLLNKTDFQEYKDAVDEWTPPSHIADNKALTSYNVLFCHLIYRLLDVIDPPQRPSTPPSFPKFCLKVAFIGKPFSGKSFSLRKVMEECDKVVSISVEGLVTKAVSSYLSEKRLIQNEVSVATNEVEDPPITADSEMHQDRYTPALSTEPESSVNVILSSIESPALVMGNHHEPVEGRQEPVEGRGSGDTLTDELLSQLSPLAQIGHRAHVAMVNGEMLDDSAIVEIIVHELKTLPDGSSWIMDNFPSTAVQAKLLGEALVGVTRPGLSLSREFEFLARRPDHVKDVSGASGLDLVLCFDVTSDNIFLRAYSLDYPKNSQELDQIQSRLALCDEFLPKLKKLYKKFLILELVDANVEKELMYSSVVKMIQEHIKNNEVSELLISYRDSEDTDRGGDVSANSLQNLKMSSKLNTKGTSSSQSNTELSTHNLNKSKKVKNVNRSSSVDNKNKKSMKSDGATSLHRSSSRFAATPVNGPVVVHHPHIPKGQPGHCFIHLPLDPELSMVLAEKWRSVENHHIKALKAVFLLLRSERESFCHYFHRKGIELTSCVHRPDTKQEFISEWQTAYNSLPTRRRRETVMKAELHQRADDLSGKLLDIANHRRKQAEQERQRILSDGWLEDRVGLLTNCYIALMQAEIDRFYETFVLEKDYYDQMKEKLPAAHPEPGRLPFIELTPTEPQDLSPSTASSMYNVEQDSTPSDETNSTGKQTPQAAASSDSITAKRRIPILPRQPPATEPTEDKALKKKGGVAAHLTPAPEVEDVSGLEPDQHLMVHVYNLAISFVHNLFVREQSDLDTAIDELSKPVKAPPTEQLHPPTVEHKEEKVGKGKKDKAKSPTSRAAKGAPPPPEPVPEELAPKLSPEEVVKRERMLLVYTEHKDALQAEERRVKLRLELIKIKCLEKIEAIKTKWEGLSQEMEECGEDSYKQEVKCVSDLVDILKQAIENEETLVHEIVLLGTSLNIRKSVEMFELSPPPSPPPQVESPHSQHFTVSQLLNLYQHLISLAPSGFILASSLVGMLQSLVDWTMDGDTVPDSWINMTRDQLEQVCHLVFGSEVDIVDWRHLLVCLAQPWSIPSPEQLLEALTKYKCLGTTSPGLLSKEQFLSTRVWLDDDSEQDQFRSARMKEAFYEVFCDCSSGGVDYRAMLLYLCADPGPGHGLKKALSLTVGQLFVGSEVTISLKEMHKVLTHGFNSEGGLVGSSTVAMNDLCDLYLTLSPTSPDSVSASVLMSHQLIWNYLVSATSVYHLTDFDAVFKSISETTVTD